MKMKVITIKIGDDFGFDIETDDFTANETVAHLFKVMDILIKETGLSKEDVVEMLHLD